MAEEIVLKTSVDLGEGTKSLRTLKEEFKATQLELDGLQRGTEQYTNALKKLGGIKDDIGDLNAEINAFNPEGKVQAFGNVIGGLASGFQAATAASALFGSENKEVEKTLLKVQAAMAFADGIKGVMALKDSFTVLGSVLQSTAMGQKLVTAAQWLWNAALNASPITLIITGVVALVAAMKLLSSSTEDASVKQERLNALHAESLKLVEQEIDKIEKRNTVINASHNSEIAILKAKGAAIEEINAKEDEFYERRRLQLAYIKGYRGQLTAEESAELLALTNEKILRSTAYVKKVSDDLEKITQKNKEELEKQTAKNKEELEKKLKELQSFRDAEADYDKHLADSKRKQDQIDFEQQQADNAYIESQKKLAFQIELDRIDKIKAEKAAARQEEIEAYKTDLAWAQAGNDATIAMSNLYFSIKSANTKKGSKEAEEDAKKQFEINKALSIASAIISGAQGVVNGLNAPYPQNIILPILAAATTAANVATISNTQFQGGSVASVKAPSSGSAPTINAPKNSNTELAPDGSIKRAVQNEAPQIKAVVVETDITRTQSRVNTIEEQAKVG